MEVQLKQRLVGLTVIFSLAVIFLPMLLDGSGLTPKHLDIEIPPAPEIESSGDIDEKLIQLDREAATLITLEPTIVDEISDPPDSADTQPSAESKPVAQDEAKAEQQIAGNSVQANEQAPGREDKPAAAAAAGETGSGPSATDKPAKVSEAKAESKPAKPAKSQVGGDLWVIQTGSFQEKNKAYAQRDLIRKSRLSAVFIEKYRHDGKLSYRVRMGPFLTRDKATVVRNKVRAKYNINAILMRYEK